MRRPLTVLTLVASMAAVIGGCNSSAKESAPTASTTTERHFVQKSSGLAAGASTTVTSATGRDSPSYESCPNGMYANPSDYRVCIPFPSPIRESFVGAWHVHGAELEIKSNGTGVVHSNCGGAVCDEEDRLAVVLSPDGKRLTATVTAISFTNAAGKAIANPYPRESQAVGDSSFFQFVAPHLMKETIIRSSLPAVDLLDGNPYWCGEHLAEALGYFCGA